MSAQELARESCLLSPSLSRMLSRLEADGLILRKTNSEDQRAIAIRLSAKGKRLHRRVAPHVEKQYKAMLTGISKDTREHLWGMLTELTAIESPSLS